MIPGFDRAVLGMTVGEEKTVTIPTGEAYGSRIDNLVLAVPREEMPEGLNPTVGQQLQMAQDDGSAAVVTVTEVSETMVTLDANHPLAGKDLVFEITLVVIQ
jgi:peptidylprolyl isomerase